MQFTYYPNSIARFAYKNGLEKTVSVNVLWVRNVRFGNAKDTVLSLIINENSRRNLAE